MSKDDSDGDDLMDFVEEATGGSVDPDRAVWRVLIIDDEKDVHSATTFALRNTEVVGRPLEFMHANSAREAREVLSKHKDIAVILLDVVMETPNAGLDLVAVIRDELKIRDTRIILRTGQPNQAPEIEVIRDYDINDYKLKSELTQARLFASLTTAIRSYKQIQTIEAGKRSLNMIVSSCAQLLTQKGINDFAQGVILHLSGLLSITPEGLICVSRKGREGDQDDPRIIAAAGHYVELIDQPVTDLIEGEAKRVLLECLKIKHHVYRPHGIALYLGGQERDMACYVSSNAEINEIDEQLLELFCSNISICADNLDRVDRLSDYAYKDVLLNLPNRNALLDEIDKFMPKSTSERGSNDFVLGMLDIDGFSEINASLGQDYGDETLKVVSKKLEQQFSDGAYVARVANDTFAVLGESNKVNAELLLEPFKYPLIIAQEEQTISFTASLVPLCDVDGGGSEAIKDAMTVLKMGKEKQRGVVHSYDPAMVNEAIGRLDMLHQLRQAYEHNQLFVVYQPKFNLQDNRITGFEALVRWRDSKGQLILPENFIPLAEKSGLIVKVGSWILKQAVATLSELHNRGWSDCHMSVNISVVQLINPGMIDMLSKITDDFGIDPKFIDLEVTESLAVKDLNASLVLFEKIKALGFTLSLDDFGTGFSSINHIQKMPIDRLKLDKTVIQGASSPDGKDIIKMIIEMAEHLNLEVVAEGVENGDQVEFLRSLRCSLAQGFHWANPLDAHALYQWLEEYK
ncbi:putative signaling protein [Thalassocella blandensis]|nr:putative signaling protein [Thalassocella blandensis]